MSDRLTSDWTETLEEAFGESGVKGTKGELIACEILDCLYIDYTYEPSNKAIQTSGIDIFIGKDGVDVKGNLHSNKTVVAVEYPKLIKSKARWWMHVNLSNPDHFIMYEVKDMIEYINTHDIPKVGKDSLCWVNQKIAGSL